MSVLLQATYKSCKILKKTANVHFSIDLESLDFEKQVVLKQLQKSKGHLFFSNDPIRDEAIKIIKDKRIGVDEHGLTNSQKVRMEIWRVWNNLEQDISFEDFYNDVTEKMIKAIKKKYDSY